MEHPCLPQTMLWYSSVSMSIIPVPVLVDRTVTVLVTHNLQYSSKGSQSLQNLVAISQKSWRPLLTLKASCIGNYGKNWLLNPGTSSQSEGYSSKWLVWRKLLRSHCLHPSLSSSNKEPTCESVVL